MAKESSNQNEQAIVTMTVRIPLDLQKRVKVAAIQQEMKVQDIVQDALEMWLRASAD